MNKILSIFAAIILTAGTIYLGILSWNATKSHDYIGVSEEQQHSIMVSGVGEVFGVPDIIKIQLGHSVEKKTVADAQKENTDKMNAVIKKLKEDFKVESADIQTANYNIYPQYDWYNGRQSLRGYQVSQNIDLKIRKLDDISRILDMAGQLGLNQVGNLSFEMDNPEDLKKQARDKAVENAKKNAEELSESVGVKLGRIISFSESGNQPDNAYNVEYKMMNESAGMGGAAPSIETGSSKIKIIANIEYEVL